MRDGAEPSDVKSDLTSGRSGDSSITAFDAWVLPLDTTPEEMDEYPVDPDSGSGPTLRSPTLSAAEAETLLQRLRAAPGVPASERVRALGAVCERFLPSAAGDEDPLRTMAIRLLSPHACLSGPAAEDVLTRMASDWTSSRLSRLIEQEFGIGAGTADPGGVTEPGFGPAHLDPDGRHTRLRPVPPPLVLTICAGTVPGVSVTAALRALLIGSAVLIKPGAGDAVLPVLFARALRQESPELARRLAVVYWPGGRGGALESRALEAADRVVVYGGADTIRAVRRRAGPRVRLTEYRHRMGLAAVRADGVAGPDELAESIVDAVVPYEQRGCVSPMRVLAVGNAASVEGLADSVAHALARRSESLPGSRTAAEAAALHQVAGAIEMRSAAGQDVEIRTGPDWAVVLEAGRESGPGGRLVRITPVGGMEALADEFRRYRDESWGVIQSVGLAGFTRDESRQVASMAADAGASRVAPLGDVPYPPPWWMHEGHGPLRALVDWTEWVEEAE